YNRRGIEDKNEIAAKTLAFIETRLRTVFSELDSVEKKQVSFKSENQVIDLSSQAQLFLSNVKDLDKRRGEIDIQLDILNNINTYLLQKREETAVNSASTIADLRIIENASAYGPIKPVSKNYYIAGFIIGILLAAFIILIREQFNRKVLFRTEIEQKTKAP